MKSSTKALLKRLWQEAEQLEVPMPDTMPLKCYIRPKGSDILVDGGEQNPDGSITTWNNGIIKKKNRKHWEWSTNLNEWKNCGR